MARLEFYLGDAEKFIAALRDGAVPRTGEAISIEGETLYVRSVTWAVDHSQTDRSELRANIVLSTTP